MKFIKRLLAVTLCMGTVFTATAAPVQAKTKVNKIKAKLVCDKPDEYDALQMGTNVITVGKYCNRHDQCWRHYRIVGFRAPEEGKYIFEFSGLDSKLYEFPYVSIGFTYNKYGTFDKWGDTKFFSLYAGKNLEDLKTGHTAQFGLSTQRWINSLDIIDEKGNGEVTGNQLNSGIRTGSDYPKAKVEMQLDAGSILWLNTYMTGAYDDNRYLVMTPKLMTYKVKISKGVWW